MLYTVITFNILNCDYNPRRSTKLKLSILSSFIKKILLKQYKFLVCSIYYTEITCIMFSIVLVTTCFICSHSSWNTCTVRCALDFWICTGLVLCTYIETVCCIFILNMVSLFSRNHLNFINFVLKPFLLSEFRPNW